MKKFLFILPVLIIAKNFSFCASCHNGRKEINLNTLKKSFIVKRLNKLKEGKSTMSYIARTLSKKDIKSITEIYGK